jgi:hypothetical protein
MVCAGSTSYLVRATAATEWFCAGFLHHESLPNPYFGESSEMREWPEFRYHRDILATTCIQLKL